MMIMPAIDLKDGKCVRLRQGLAEEVTVYSDDPAAMARHWQDEGGRYLHVVDLDGAFQGRPMHLEILREIVAAIGIPVEVGGGLRTDADIEKVLDTGVDRVILGTRACEFPEQIEDLTGRYGGSRIAVGIDARDGMVQTKGWVETTDVRATDLARKMEDAGVGTIIYTDTARDGMLEGVNVVQMGEICAAVDCDVVASGGVSTAEDIMALAALGLENLVGAIVGKALYDKTVSVAQLQRVANGRG